jgi:hypothetical protein
MTLLDGIERLRETFIVVVYFRWPFGVGSFRVVSVRIPVSAIKKSLFLMQNLRPFLDRYPEATSIKPISGPIRSFTDPAVQVFLGQIRRGLGERDVTLAQCGPDVRG